MADQGKKGFPHASQGGESVPVKRSDYASPCLQVYGNVRELTAGGSATAAESAPGARTHRP